MPKNKSRVYGAICALALAGATLAAATDPGANPNAPRKAATAKSSPFAAANTSMHARDYYQMHWGVDSLEVKAVTADQLIRFSYRVVDPVKAKSINAKEASPQLNDEVRRVSLVVPTMDKVGQLRQSGPPESGKTYWMVFSNKGNIIKRGSRVAVVIGEFRANGLAVE
jgi:hypothetical protein